MKILMTLISSCPFPLLIGKDAYAALVFGNLGTVIVSSNCTFRDMGFFLYRGSVSFKGCSRACGAET
jgi:hypothetical protein